MCKVNTTILIILIGMISLSILEANGLNCLVCNSGIKGQESCADGNSEENNEYIMACNTKLDFNIARNYDFESNTSMPNYEVIKNETKGKEFRGLFAWGRRSDLPSGFERMKMIEDEMTGPFACRKLVFKVPYQLTGTSKIKDRIIRYCSQVSTDEKIGRCETDGASLGSEVMSCLCNKIENRDADDMPCNRAEYLVEPEVWVSVLLFVIIFSLRLSFGEE